MANRIHTMRASLRRNLENLDSSLNWEHITSQVFGYLILDLDLEKIITAEHTNTHFDPFMQMQVGMFCFSGLSSDQVKHLEKDFHIYMTPDGRIRYIML